MHHGRLHGKLIIHDKFCGVRRCALLFRYGFLNLISAMSWWLLYRCFIAIFKFFCAEIAVENILIPEMWLPEGPRGDSKKFLGSQSLTIFYGPLINYAVIRPLFQRIGAVGLAVRNSVWPASHWQGLKWGRVAQGRRPGTLWTAGSIPGLLFTLV